MNTKNIAIATIATASALLVSAITFTGWNIAFEPSDKSMIDLSVGNALSNLWGGLTFVAPYLGALVGLAIVIGGMYMLSRKILWGMSQWKSLSMKIGDTSFAISPISTTLPIKKVKAPNHKKEFIDGYQACFYQKDVYEVRGKYYKPTDKIGEIIEVQKVSWAKSVHPSSLPSFHPQYEQKKPSWQRRGFHKQSVNSGKVSHKKEKEDDWFFAKIARETEERQKNDIPY